MMDPRRGERRERGYVLVAMLLLMAVMTATAVAVLGLATTENDIAKNQREGAAAFAIGEAGVEHARREVLCTTNINALLAQPYFNFPSFGTTVSFGGGSYRVSVTNNVAAQGTIAADPGGALNDTDGIVVLTSTGSYRSAQRLVRAVVEAAGMCNPPSPIYLLPGFDLAPAHLNVNITHMDGASFQITGNDMNIDGSSGAAPPVVGIGAAPGSRSNVLSESSGHASQITGVGGTGSAQAALSSSITPTMVQSVWQQLTPLAVQLPTADFTSTETIGTPSVPQLSWRVGDGVRMRGSSSGAGILIVDRVFEMEGNAVFNGIVIVRGQGEVIMKGTARVNGFILAQNTGTFSGNSGETRFDIRGNASITYSREALALAARLLPTRLLAWLEMP